MIHRKINNFICTETEPIVYTKAGKLRGYKSDDVYCFKGIEYAKAKRFHMPESVESWDGVKNALAYGPGCPEMTMLNNRNEMDQLVVPGRIWSISENCQNLNIWTKSISASAKRPVMVWLHGGGYAGGASTHLYSYDGYEMCDKYNVVLMSVNHRLNMLGYLDLSRFGEQYAHTGNLGMADLVAALEWVRDNITAFGGNPNNVTIYGQSGGGGKVTTLMQMPAADGLYHRAIIQSGVIPRGLFLNSSDRVALRAAELLGLDKDSICEIETMDYQALASAINKAATELDAQSIGLWSPVPDGNYYVGAPLDVGFRTETKNIPLIVGSCVTEFGNGSIGDKTVWSDDMRFNELKKVYGKKAEVVKREFQKAYPELDWSYAVSIDTGIRSAVIEFINRRCAEADAPVYNYIFAFESLLMGGQLLGHNSELHFMFHNAAYMDAMCKPGATERIQDEIAGAWANFAYTGNPNSSNLSTWDEYTPETGACMQLGDVTILKHKHDAELLSALTIP